MATPTVPWPRGIVRAQRDGVVLVGLERWGTYRGKGGRGVEGEAGGGGVGGLTGEKEEKTR